ncbi:Mini-ribonuclease 3-like protein [Fusobacterium sp. DD29]|jgi:ribonuclease-3 family protein|uniref:ribonuclease III domain-containing protein n=1 Tax=unclassified Fusobacterium TaxID=2648384 RepID=UPI001B8AC4D6|nr:MULTISPECIES: ribonuclease III domain-containing protein [unclassified Fusobacterium]MBR8701990.1 Mini-ribonuclease 3-like protein [Fusobacterium sp. DD45]MBR8711795.1 Mini-ribonuclease 3-like protein [Fusobacterium sp. DD28]MBR8750211.1 Mini-ribonuclease 3-like protein [Fusobacterium sp. DD29]MBR8752353.1 Mini-ribonuclease 3-like protein [Fusobacterium sp. DD26]MBR8762453.1 Mini-ribonuclease 3-like protein [Fusobacterium sp. DD25]
MDNVDLRETNGVVLAYLGDAVWELELRKYWISKGLNLRNLNKRVKECVNAKKQSELYRVIFPTLEEKYQMLGNRSKNGNIKSFPRSCSVQEYREATAFESLIAGFYIDGRQDLIEKTVLLCVEERKDEV